MNERSFTFLGRVRGVATELAQRLDPDRQGHRGRQRDGQEKPVAPIALVPQAVGAEGQEQATVDAEKRQRGAPVAAPKNQPSPSRIGWVSSWIAANHENRRPKAANTMAHWITGLPCWEFLVFTVSLQPSSANGRHGASSAVTSLARSDDVAGRGSPGRHHRTPSPTPACASSASSRTGVTRIRRWVMPW